MDAIRAHANVIGVSLEPDSPASRSAAVLKTWHVPLVIPLLLLALMAALPAIDHAEAQTYTGVLALDPVPSQIRSGSTVTFSGQLTTTSGHAVTGATIHIRDDVTFGRDTLIATATTDDTGRFAATWTAKSRSSGSWDFFAAYDGASNISGARSETYVVRVSSGSGPSGQTGSAAGGSTSIYLSPVPQQVYTGDSVTFTGWLASNGQPLAGKLVRIGENDPGACLISC